MLWLPESVRFLTVRGGDRRKIARIMARISPELENVTINPEAAQDRERQGLPVKHLFAEGRSAATLLLWVPFFMNLLILYFIVSWLPALLRQVHMPISAGVAAATIFGVGSVIGSVAEGPMTDRWGPYSVLLSEFGLCVVLCASLSFVATSLPLVMTVAFFLGFTVTAIQAGLNSLAASFYPTSIRSTGVGWALGIGRIGSVTGPMLGGILLKIGWTPQQILLATAVPAFCAGLAIMISYRLPGNSSAYRAAPGDVPVVSH
jgi:AAHS family 4-hydroxybenzoate transporter-like MFS transporter